MEGFLQGLAAVFDWLISLNNFVVMPVIIFLFAWLWFKASVGDAFRAALRIAIGYVGQDAAEGIAHQDDVEDQHGGAAGL